MPPDHTPCWRIRRSQPVWQGSAVSIECFASRVLRKSSSKSEQLRCNKYVCNRATVHCFSQVKGIAGPSHETAQLVECQSQEKYPSSQHRRAGDLALSA